MTKTHILDEIRRTAAANGGEALGWRRFETETGIKLTDWSKYWARWSEAVREAGLTPKQFSAAYDEGTLLDCFAKLTREMGRLPAWSDLKLKMYSDPEFPSEKVFRRFESKEKLIGKLVEHCRAKGGWDDVLVLCEGYVPKRNKQEQESGGDAASDESEIGFVYLLRSGRFYKIGRSNSVGRREYELGIQLPEPAKMVHVIRTDDPPGIEAYWHRRFEAKRKNGEWFELDAADVAVFKRRKFFM
jgi:hypothetical protein